MCAAFPDLFLDVRDVLADGDRVDLRYVLCGTHDGELMGVPASGQRVSSDGRVFARLESGQVVERWGVQDMMTLLQQIGALPAAQATTG
jgi:predicted ester cyclase